MRAKSVITSRETIEKVHGMEELIGILLFWI